MVKSRTHGVCVSSSRAFRGQLVDLPTCTICQDETVRRAASIASAASLITCTFASWVPDGRQPLHLAEIPQARRLSGCVSATHL